MVEVPVTPSPLTEQQYATLREAVNPVEESDDLGVSLYSMVRSFISNL